MVNCKFNPTGVDIKGFHGWFVIVIGLALLFIAVSVLLYGLKQYCQIFLTNMKLLCWKFLWFTYLCSAFVGVGGVLGAGIVSSIFISRDFYSPSDNYISQGYDSNSTNECSSSIHYYTVYVFLIFNHIQVVTIVLMFICALIVVMLDKVKTSMCICNIVNAMR